MPIALAIFLIIFAVMTHELGHAILMKRYEVALSEICLFGVGPKLLTFRLKKFFGDTPITLRLIPLGAFVRPKEPMDSFIGEKRYEHIFAGGVAINFMYAGILLAPVLAYAMFRGNVALFWLLPAFLSFGVGLCLWKAPRIIGYAVTILGFSVLAFIIYNVVSLPVGESVAGPVGVGMIISKINSYLYGIIIAAVISANLGLINILPLFPLDGGHIFLSLLYNKRPAFMHKHGITIKIFLSFGMILLLILAFGSDIIKLLDYR